MIEKKKISRVLCMGVFLNSASNATPKALLRHNHSCHICLRARRSFAAGMIDREVVHEIKSGETYQIDSDEYDSDGGLDDVEEEEYDKLVDEGE